MTDAQLHFAGYLQGRVEEIVQGVAHHALGGVLHRHHAVVALARFHLGEHGINRGLGHADGGVAEMFQRGGLGEGTLRAQVGHLQRPLQRQAGRHDLAKYVGDTVTCQRPRVALDNPPQHLCLAFRAVVNHFGVGLTAQARGLGILQLDRRHPLGALRPATDQRLDVPVDGIDIRPDLVEIPGVRLIRHCW